MGVKDFFRRTAGAAAAKRPAVPAPAPTGLMTRGEVGVDAASDAAAPALDVERLPPILKPFFETSRVIRVNPHQGAILLVQYLQKLAANRSLGTGASGWIDFSELCAWWEFFCEEHSVEHIDARLIAEYIRSVPGVRYRPHQRLGAPEFAPLAARIAARAMQKNPLPVVGRPTIYWIPTAAQVTPHDRPVMPRQGRASGGLGQAAVTASKRQTPAKAAPAPAAPPQAATVKRRPPLKMPQPMPRADLPPRPSDELAVGLVIEPQRRVA